MDRFFIGTLTVIVIFVGIIVGMDFYVKSQNASAPQVDSRAQLIYPSGLRYSPIDPLPTVLSDLGIDSNTTAIQSAKFKAIKKPSVTVLYQSTAATQDLGWNEED